LFKKTADNFDNTQRLNATYFYAYCAIKTKQFWSANHYLKKILERNPDWNKINEVYYLQSLLFFEKKEYANAVASSQKVKSKFMKTDTENMKWNYLYSSTLKDTVLFLQKKYPKDSCLSAIAGRLLKDELVAKKNKAAEKYQYEETEDKKTYEPWTRNDTLSIAVVLPFELDENVQGNTITNNLYVFDLYTGIRMAIDSLKNLGVKIKLTAYDYAGDSTQFYRLLEQPALKEANVMVGPLHNSFSNKVAQFANTNKILVVNPLSTNLKFTEKSDWVYLTKTSTETQTKEAAFRAYQYFKPKKALIIAGKNAKDSLNALMFQKSFESVGGKVLAKSSLNVASLAKLSTLFAKKTLDSTGFIYVSSKDQNVGVNIMKKLAELNRNTPLLVSPEWLDFQSVSFQQMQKQNLYFIAPDYVNHLNDTIAAVSNYLQERTHSLPSYYTFCGFDLVGQLVRLSSQDAAFAAQPNLKGRVLSGGLLNKGYDFSKGKDNRSFGIYTFTDQGFLEMADKPTDD
jgi:ABC-type branched-subunit amino acid transport system substrate-binding protein